MAAELPAPEFQVTVIVNASASANGWTGIALCIRPMVSLATGIVNVNGSATKSE